MSSSTENHTCDLVEKRPDRLVVENRWILRVKTNLDGSVDKFKTRLVAKGYSQKTDIDYTEIFSPFVRFDTIRVMLSVAAKLKLHLAQFDVKTAFLCGELEETIYMR
jgi:hypothetical protein